MAKKLSGGEDPRDPRFAGADGDDPDQREPNEPPAALMRKKSHYAMWILFALALGGLIALMMVAMSG
jgi:hypothetical protein